MKHRGEFCRILLVSPTSLHGAELLEGWSLQQNEQRDCWPCQLDRDDGRTKYSVSNQPSRSHPIGLVRPHLFAALSRDMVSCPAFWARAKTTSVQNRAIRFTILGSNSTSKVTASNQQLKFVFWFLKEALTCPTKKVGVILVFPEDLSGGLESGPSSIWVLKEFRSLEDYHGGRRGAVYLCQFGGSEHMRPVGICTNLDKFFNFIHLGWPELVTTVLDQGTSLSYSGPLQKACPCEA